MPDSGVRAARANYSRAQLIDISVRRPREVAKPLIVSKGDDKRKCVNSRALVSHYWLASLLTGAADVKQVVDDLECYPKCPAKPSQVRNVVNGCPRDFRPRAGHELEKPRGLQVDCLLIIFDVPTEIEGTEQFHRLAPDEISQSHREHPSNIPADPFAWLADRFIAGDCPFAGLPASRVYVSGIHGRCGQSNLCRDLRGEGK